MFCGCGGADLGLIGGFSYLGEAYAPNPFEIVFALDFDNYAVKTYNRNFEHRALCLDIKSLRPCDLPEFDLLLGGFPCQSFSTVNPTKDTDDERANLYKQLVRILSDKRPKYFIFENVKGLLTLEGGAIIKKIVAEFSNVGYTVQYQLLRAANYGVPQLRDRIIIVGVREDCSFRYNFPEETHAQAIDLLKKQWVPLGKVIDKLDITDKRYYFSQRAVEGMKNAKNNMKRGLFQSLDAPCLTVTAHLSKVSLNSRDPVLLVDSEKEIYRRFTPREAARIQSFPDKFIFDCTETQAYKQIGNAVPPVLMWHVARKFAQSVSVGASLDSK